MAFVMHADVLMRPFRREAIIDRRQPFLRWSPIFGGAILAIGLWTLLQVLGMGVGLAAIHTDDAGSLRGTGTGIWSIVAPLIALFVGGLLVGRTSGARDRKVGAMHASVMWALALSFGLWAMMSLLSSVAGGVVVARHMQLNAADKTGHALLLGGLMMLLSLGAAIAGGALGVPRVRDEEFPIITSTPEPID